jgi:hypothetical protein
MVEIEAKPGASTSEFKLALLVNIVSIIVVAVGAGLEVAAQLGYGANWIGTALAVIGFITKLLSNGAYTDSRVAIKVAALNATKEQAVEETKVISSVPEALTALDNFTRDINHRDRS